DAGDAARRRRDRAGQRTSVRLCGQPARQGGRARGYSLRDVRRSARRPVRLLDPEVPDHAGRAMSRVRSGASGPLERRVRRADCLSSVRFRRATPTAQPIIDPMPLLDTCGRPLRNLRLSVTDRCNLRCAYCMPEAEYVWLPREDVLRFEEISTLVDV